MTRRTARVEDLLRAEIAHLITVEMGDPRVSMVTVVGVRVSPDLRHAVVQISVLGEQEERLESLGALRKARGFIRSRLARRVRMRATPELVFELDRGAEHSQRIHDILESLHDNDTST
jgi:ribosome-binding factor A